jgi:hypothetical protein
MVAKTNPRMGVDDGRQIGPAFGEGLENAR